MQKGKPPRLDRVFQSYDPPLYFVTFATRDRRQVLARREVLTEMDHFAAKSIAVGNALGRFVIMPDHLHLFVRIHHESRLSTFVRLLKQALTRRLVALGESEPIWQPGFFDRLLRNSESYGEKWNYVRENPVRAGLVAKADDWPYQGEPILIDRV